MIDQSRIPKRRLNFVNKIYQNYIFCSSCGQLFLCLICFETEKAGKRNVSVEICSTYRAKVGYDKNVQQIITYSLLRDRECSCSFYQDRSRFTDEMIAQGEQQVGALVDSYLAFLRETSGEAIRTRPEYLLELLVMGVLWRIYGNDAMALTGPAARLLGRLADLGERNGWLKKVAYLARGLFAFQLHSSRSSLPVPPSRSPIDQLSRLLRWMEAAGRLAQEAQRLRGWEKFLAALAVERVCQCLQAVMTYAAWFEHRSLEALGDYTPNVEHFLAHSLPGYRWREDIVLCSRKRVEYHLDMVGTEILNRALRAPFLATARKVVLVPPCMRIRSEDGPQELRCQAISTPFGAHCMACTPGCRVHQLTRLGEKYHFEVFILPDDLRVFTSPSLPLQGQQQIGIVGISCVLTNIQGGWDVRDLGIPAQGLLLDYCGCRYHWHKQGIPTDVDFHQLLQMLGVNAG